MSESIIVPSSGTRKEIYDALLPQIRAVVESEDDKIANQANVAAILKETFDFLWIGFYRVVGEELVLGPFQGPLACTRIPKGKGVCGACFRDQKTIIVPNVDEFPGHIACSSKSKSEIVVPVFSAGQLVAVLDVDSENLDDFSEADQKGLEAIVSLLG